MCGKGHLGILWRTTLAVLAVIFFGVGCKTVPTKPVPVVEPVPTETETKDSGLTDESDEDKATSLPSLDVLLDAKLEALRAKLAEQEASIAEAELALIEEKEKQRKVFDDRAYLKLSIINTADPREYKLLRTTILVDGKRVARGGPRNRGLPRKSEFFFGPVIEGCHDLVVKADYVRLKNDVISRFKVNRVEHVTRELTFIAKKGHRVEVNIEGFEAHNEFFKFYRGPDIRFNKFARPNFVLGSPLVSLDEIFNQGKLFIDYVTEDTSNHRLVEKSLSIDGLPVLVKDKHDDKNGSVVFNAPLSEGKHSLGVTLVFGEKKWVTGGPTYNFRLNFDRDFYVIGGQTTTINLAGMPKGGFRSSMEDSRYARVTSKIMLGEQEEYFPPLRCKAILEKERQEQKRLEALSKVNVPLDTIAPQRSPVREEPKPSEDELNPPKIDEGASSRKVSPANAKSAVGE